MPEPPANAVAGARVPGRRVALRLRDGPWPARTALFFVLLTLVALVIVPVLVQRRVNDLREDAEVSEPARTLVTRLQFNLVRELASLNERLLGGDSASLRTYAEARDEEQAIFAQLEPLATRLGPGVLAQHARAQVLAEQWHARVTEDEFFRSDGTVADTLVDMRELALFENVLRALGDLDEAIVAAAGTHRDRIIGIEELGLRTTLVLGILALLAAAAVAVLVARVRHFAGESERRRVEVEEALRESARLAEARTRLLRGITHDVKNPLGAAKGYAELLAMGIKGPVSSEQVPFVEGIQRSIDGALAIIADLLDVARADSGGLTVRREPVDLVRLVREIANDQRTVAGSAGHSLDVTGPDELRFHTDPTRVRQVLDNLLSNAIKYTPPPGRVTVEVGVEEREGPAEARRTGRWATLRVRDTGPGIPPEMREAIFDEFARLDDHTAMKGHGLGLAISRRIARLLGGDLNVADAPGPGATFVLWLPFRDGGTGDPGTP
jgi:signal transduction histidine kinase